jgi:hypothetical protein
MIKIVNFPSGIQPLRLGALSLPNDDSLCIRLLIRASASDLISRQRYMIPGSV